MACFTDDLSYQALVLAMRSSHAAGLALAGTVKQSLFSRVLDGARKITLPSMSTILDAIPGDSPTAKAAITGCVALTAWKAVDLGIHKQVSTLAQAVVPGLRWIRRRVGPLQVQYDPQLFRKSCILESRREGSDESVMTMPKSQCRIGIKRDGVLIVVGCAVRFDGGYLVGPDHVLGGDETEPKYAYGSQSTVSLRNKERIPLDTDLVAIKLSDAELSTIGISVCKINAIPDCGSFGQIVGPESKGTVGIIKADARCFGRVIYEGTTLGGYSGAAYTVGAFVVGLHQMGGQLNGGYSASYVWSLLRLALNQRLESSDEWLLGQFKAGRRLTWRNTGDPDLVQIVINGAYSVVERDSMSRAFGNNWLDSDTIERATHEMSYGDYECTAAGEANSSKSGVSSQLENTPALDQQSLQDIMNELQTLSKKQRAGILRSIKQCKTPKSVLTGPEKRKQPESLIA